MNNLCDVEGCIDNALLILLCSLQVSGNEKKNKGKNRKKKKDEKCNMVRGFKLSKKSLSLTSRWRLTQKSHRLQLEPT